MNDPNTGYDPWNEGRNTGYLSKKDDLQDALREYDQKGQGLNVLPASSSAMTTILDAARKYQDILNTDIDEWIEAEARIAWKNRELSWNRVHQSQAENLLAALGIPEPVK